MTLIATFMRDGMPFVLADVLATSFGGPVTHKPLPTFGHVSEVLTEDIGYSISDLVQKAYIATDNLCIAVAGNYFGCKTATESIFEAYRGNNADFADFKQFLTKSLDLGKLGVDVLGWIYDRGKLVGFRWDSKRRTEVEIDNFFVAGTGSEFFEDFLKRDSEYEFVQAPNAALFDADPTLKPRMRALLDVGDLINEEMRFGQTLLHLFGGGLQVIYFDGSKFRYLENYAILYCNGKVDGRGAWEFEIGGPYLHFSYAGDRLAIRRIDVAQSLSSPTGRIIQNVSQVMPTIPTALVTTCESALASGVLQPIKTDFYVLPIFWHWPGVGYIPTFKTLPAVPENTPFTVRLTQVKDDLVMEVGPNARNNFGAWADHAVGIARKVLGSQRPA